MRELKQKKSAPKIGERNKSQFPEATWHQVPPSTDSGCPQPCTPAHAAHQPCCPDHLASGRDPGLRQEPQLASWTCPPLALGKTCAPNHQEVVKGGRKANRATETPWYTQVLYPQQGSGEPAASVWSDQDGTPSFQNLLMTPPPSRPVPSGKALEIPLTAAPLARPDI